MKDTRKKFEEWEEVLNPSEVEALTDYGHKAGDELWANEVFEIIVEWNGGIATAYHIKQIISRVYGVEIGGISMNNPCFGCGCYDEDMGCTCSSIDLSYVCPLEPDPSIEDFLTEDEINTQMKT